MLKRLVTLIILTGVSTTLFGMSINPIPEKIEVEPRKAKLGKKLFFDPVLSVDGTVSCAHCHDLQNGGDDGLKVSFGIQGKKGNINAPTVYNAVFNFRQFWNGRAKDLKEQAEGPILSAVEMGHSSMRVVVDKLRENKTYLLFFNAIYSDGITKDNVLDAIAEFEKTLITPNAPFDRYLKGETYAINPEAKKGYELFKSKGCIFCHHGVNIGGNLYNKFGIYKNAKSASLGRYEVTKREEDKFVFKVPSLRNVELTAPYMHDGRAKTLQEAVVIMSQYQLGRYIEKEEIDAIVTFLKTLTGEIPEGL